MRDQHVVVVGGSAGMGFAVAERAAERGARVTIGARNVVRLASADVVSGFDLRSGPGPDFQIDG